MKAHQLLSDESKWIKCSFAHDASGLPVNTKAAEAVCWCLQGALRRCYEGFSKEEEAQYNAAIDAVCAFIPMSKRNPIADWNDAPERTFQEVKDLLVKLDI